MNKMFLQLPFQPARGRGGSSTRRGRGAAKRARGGRGRT